MYCEIDIRATKSCIFASVGFNGKINQNYKNTGFSSTDVNFTIHFIIVLARPPLLWQEHAWVPAVSKNQRSEPSTYFLIYDHTVSARAEISART